MHVELPIGAFLAAFLVIIPLPWHWRARNIPTLSIIAWLFCSDIIYGVNSLVWAENVRMIIPVWCDIVTKIQIGATMALPACCLCLCIHLERIASVRQIHTSFTQKRRQLIFDLFMCWGLPCVYMALHYIVQGHRYDIIEDFGCRPAIYTSVQSILIVWALPLVVVTLTMVFGGLSLRHFFIRRITFAKHLRENNSALTTSRYLRLMAMALVQMFWGAFMIIINVWFTCKNGLRPWTGWADVHSNFSRVAVFPTRFIPSSILRWTHFTWWTVPISSILFFLFFSFGRDSVKEYKACVDWIARVIFRHQSGQSHKLALPSFTRSPPLRRKSLLDSFADKKSISSETDSPSSPRNDIYIEISSVPTPTSTTSFSSRATQSTLVVS